MVKRMALLVVVLSALPAVMAADVHRAEAEREYRAVDMIVWLSGDDPSLLFVSAQVTAAAPHLHNRGIKTTPNYPLDMRVSPSGRFRVSEPLIVTSPLDDETVVRVEFVTWQSVDDPFQIFISQRVEGEYWWTHGPLTNLELQGSGQFYRALIRFGVYVPSVPPPVPPGFEPEITFVGDIDKDRQGELRSLTLNTMSFMKARLGAIAQDFSIYFVDDQVWWYSSDDYVDDRCVVIAGNTASVSMRCAEDSIAYAYSRVLQSQLAGPEYDLPYTYTTWALGPGWLIEGSAQYLQDEYGRWRRAVDSEALLYQYGDTMENIRVQLSKLEEPLPLPALESYRFPGRGGANWDNAVRFWLATLAVDWLVERVGDQSLATYFRLLPESLNWQTAFHEAFGVTVADAYDQFDAYFEDYVPRRWDVSGTALLPNGDSPWKNWTTVSIAAYPDPSSRWVGTFYEEGQVAGEFSSWRRYHLPGIEERLPDGIYRFRIGAWCRGDSIEFGWWGDGEMVPTREQAQPFVVDGQNRDDLHIVFPALPSELDDRCDFGPTRQVHGTVTADDGTPLPGILMSAWHGTSPWTDFAWTDYAVTDDDGRFTLNLPDGEYNYFALRLGKSLGWGHGGEYTRIPESLSVSGEDITGVRVSIRGDPQFQIQQAIRLRQLEPQLFETDE